MATETFWDRIKWKAKAKGLTLGDIAKECNIVGNSIYTYSANNTIPKKETTINNIAKILGTSKEYLLTGDESKDYEEFPVLHETEFAKMYYALDKETREVVFTMVQRFYDIQHPTTTEKQS